MNLPKTVEEKVAHFYPIISRPVKYASLFYTYYYLVEIEKRRELRREFERLRNDLWIAFYNYGVYSVGKEMLHLKDKFLFGDEEGQPVSYLDDYVSTEIISDMFYDAYPSIREKENKSLVEMFTRFAETDVVPLKGLSSVKHFCIYIDMITKAFSNPTQFLTICMDIFNLRSESVEFVTPSSDYFWVKQYGGEMWAKICKTLLSSDKVKPTIFVDACWNIQHNTGVWMDKVVLDFEAVPLESLGMLGGILSCNLHGDLVSVYQTARKIDLSLYKYEDYFK